MKRFLLWSFGRGSFQYDVICGIILAFIFLAPRSSFNDRPVYMRLTGDPVHQSVDDNGNTVYTVKVDSPSAGSVDEMTQSALSRLKEAVGRDTRVMRTQRLYDTTGVLVAVSFWVER